MAGDVTVLEVSEGYDSTLIVSGSEGDETVVILDNETLVVATGEFGPQGPPGPEGPEGPVGPGGGLDTHVFTQDSPSVVWTVIHNLDRFPVTTVYVTDQEVIADVLHISTNQFTVTFGTPVTGRVVYI